MVKFFQSRSYSDDPELDAVYDPERGAWFPIGQWMPETTAPGKSSSFDRVTVSYAYSKITIAGAILIVVWALVFVAIRLDTGKWPGQGAPAHYNPRQVVGTEIDTGASLHP